MVLQQDQSGTGSFELEILRVKKPDMKNIELSDIQQVVYTGPKKPSMPNNDSFQSVPEVPVLATATAA